MCARLDNRVEATRISQQYSVGAISTGLHSTGAKRPVNQELTKEGGNRFLTTVRSGGQGGVRDQQPPNRSPF